MEKVYCEMFEKIKCIVIVPSYNRGEYIGECLESILMQKTNFNFRIIVADDASEDNTDEVVDNYIKAYPDKIEMWKNKVNKKLYSNILRVYKELNSEYFTVLDADDFWCDEGYLQKALDFLDNHKKYTIYCGNFFELKDGKLEKYYTDNVKQWTTYSIEDFLYGWYRWGNTTCSVYRNVFLGDKIPDILSEVEGTLSGESFRADTDRNIMHIKYGYSYYIDEVYGVYRINEKGIYTTASEIHNNLLEARARIDYIDFYNGKYEVGFYMQSMQFFNRVNKKIIEDNERLNYDYVNKKIEGFIARYGKNYLYFYKKMHFVKVVIRNILYRCLKYKKL